MDVDALLEDILMALRGDRRVPPFGAALDHGEHTLSVAFGVNSKTERFVITVKEEE